jgi:hypothetical protein
MTTGFTTATHRGVTEPDWVIIPDPFSNEHVAETTPANKLDVKTIYPKDFILELWMKFARKHCETNDFQILGAILPVCGAIMGRTVWMDFFGEKYPNIFTMIVAAPGQRKSTLINLVEKLARRAIEPGHFMSSVSSEEALFEQFDPKQGGKPDQILIEDEGNTLFTGWEKTSYGQIVSKRVLKLYDGAPWTQSFKGKKQGETGSSTRQIQVATANLLVGATYNICQLGKLDVKSGMWRRFLKYPAEGLARKIYFAEKIDNHLFNNLVMKFETLRASLEAPVEYQLSDEAKELYMQFKDRNAEKAEAIPNDLNPANEAKGSVLSEELALVVKVSIIFERCREAMASIKLKGCTIHADTLQLAHDHIQQCIYASDNLENIGRRSEIRDTAQTIHAQVLMEFTTKAVNGFIPLSKTELTNKFCRNSGRQNAMNNFALYSEAMPDLESIGLVKRYPVPGTKKVFYLFKIED